MGAEMLLEIENLGLINKANLDIGKINVIVGKNSTGKSTSSKFLFSLLTAASSEGTQLANMDIHSKLLNFVLYWGTKGSQEMEDKFKQIHTLMYFLRVGTTIGIAIWSSQPYRSKPDENPDRHPDNEHPQPDCHGN